MFSCQLCPLLVVVYAGSASVAGERPRTGTTIGPGSLCTPGVEGPAEERLFQQLPLMGSVDYWPMAIVTHSNSGARPGRHPSSDVVDVG